MREVMRRVLLCMLEAVNHEWPQFLGYEISFVVNFVLGRSYLGLMGLFPLFSGWHRGFSYTHTRSDDLSEQVTLARSTATRYL